MKKIPQVDIAVDKAELERIAGCIDLRWLSEGPCAKQFVEELQAFLNTKHLVLAPNGTLALWLAVYALDLPPGSDILVPSFTFYGTATSVVFAGHKPVFVDVDPHTYCARAEDFERALTPNTRAMMPVHIYGQAADMTGIMAFAKKHNLKVLEDAAQGFGVTHKGQQTGTFGDMGIVSFFSDKTITTGEGGAIYTNDTSTFERLRLLRNQGRPNAGTFVHPALGMNFRLTDMQAAVGLAQLKKYDTIKASRLKNWKLYEDGLKGVGDIVPMQVHKDSNLIPFRFPITSQHKKKLVEAMEKENIETRGFFYPMHLQPQLKSNPPQTLPVAEKLSETGMCLPVHMHITESDIARVVDVLKRAFQ
jgi:perosamine synthetase